MFEVGEYVIYGNNGVCRVESIGPIKMPGVTKERIYYTLTINCSNGSKVFTPVDSDKVRMRIIMTQKEAEELLEEIPKLDIYPMSDQRKNEAVFKEAMKTGDCKNTMKVIKTLHKKKLERLSEGKNMNVSDEKYLRMASNELFEEVSVALNMDLKQVEKNIFEKMSE